MRTPGNFTSPLLSAVMDSMSRWSVGSSSSSTLAPLIISVKTDFIRYAEYLTERFLTDVAKFDSFDSFYTNINDCAQTVLNSAVSAMIKMLVSNGIFTSFYAIISSKLNCKYR